MPELCDGRLDELLKEAASRLATKQPPRPKDCTLIAMKAAPANPTLDSKVQAKAQDPKSVMLRDPRPAEKKTGKDNAGPGWFGIPKTDPNDPELKRDLQILHMRGTAIDSKRHYKKESLKAKVPRYAHVGRIVEGPTEFYSARLTRKERTQTLVDELLSAEKASGKFRSKYEAIQTKKASGKKAFYKKFYRQDPYSTLSAWQQHRIAQVSRYICREDARFDTVEANRPLPGAVTFTETPQASVMQPSKAPEPTRNSQAISESDPVQHFFGKTKENEPRYPRGVQALYLQPLRREAEYGIPSCDLQLRSYSLRNLEFFSDFALRAAYYLKLPAFGPVPLPRITERWTVPRSSFIFKKSQENFERITMRRLVQIRDGNPETVQLWLAFLQKHAYYGIGMKANVWDFGKLGVGKAMDAIDPETTEAIDSRWNHLGQNRELDTVEKVEEFLATVRFDKDSGKRSEGERRFLQTQWKKDEAAKRKAALNV
ncbi:ribosomal protein S10p/S20e [Colletotrichum tamarilloi]|uniref:Ribosomal protein S10p/S20e n=1 Tax=Colletotrichum tamarilloi TaxID=1209934 RepID=A0ABQ9QW33_9PEZI|nr:ribosomal protein S10p/S20e [Colletotrichum tamarilloi]KAK1487004.1 ribosomal protein S10p/S20e [Colletotrichum tamarilloi]